jgi:hypothetical protein
MDAEVTRRYPLDRRVNKGAGWGAKEKPYHDLNDNLS